MPGNDSLALANGIKMVKIVQSADDRAAKHNAFLRNRRTAEEKKNVIYKFDRFDGLSLLFDSFVNVPRTRATVLPLFAFFF